MGVPDGSAAGATPNGAAAATAGINTHAQPGYWEGPNQQRTEFAQPNDTGYQTGPNKPPTTSEMTEICDQGRYCSRGPPAGPAGPPAPPPSPRAADPPVPAYKYDGRAPGGADEAGDSWTLRYRQMVLRSAEQNLRSLYELQQAGEKVPVRATRMALKAHTTAYRRVDTFLKKAQRKNDERRRQSARREAYKQALKLANMLAKVDEQRALAERLARECQ